MLARLHGRRTALLFGVTVTALAVLAGWTVNALGIPATPVLDARIEADSKIARMNPPAGGGRPGAGAGAS